MDVVKVIEVYNFVHSLASHVGGWGRHETLCATVNPVFLGRQWKFLSSTLPAVTSVPARGLQLDLSGLPLGDIGFQAICDEWISRSYELH